MRPDMPVLIGGDFNTSTFDLAQKQRRRACRGGAGGGSGSPGGADALRADVRCCCAERGYDWDELQRALAATRSGRGPTGRRQPPFGKIDWFFARGLRCSDPAIIPAVDAAGVAISDHEVLAVTIAPA